jgi:hypothetical protein
MASSTTMKILQKRLRLSPRCSRWLVGSFLLFALTFSAVLGTYSYTLQKRVELARQDFINRFSPSLVHAQTPQTTK